MAARAASRPFGSAQPAVSRRRMQDLSLIILTFDFSDKSPELFDSTGFLFIARSSFLYRFHKAYSMYVPDALLLVSGRKSTITAALSVFSVPVLSIRFKTSLVPLGTGRRLAEIFKVMLICGRLCNYCYYSEA